MKRTKFIQRTVSTFLAAAMLATLASCNAKLPGSRNADVEMTNQPRQIMNYFTTENIEMPEDLSYAQSMFYSGENLYIFGDKSSDAAETFSGIYDIASKELKDVPTDKLNMDYLYFGQIMDGKLILFYSEKETYNARFAMVNPENGEVLADVDIGSNAYTDSIIKNASGDLVTMISEWGGVSQKYFIKTLDAATLEEKSSKDITEALNISANAYLSGGVVDDAGNFYSLVIEYDMKAMTGDGEPDMKCKLVKFDSEGNLIFENDEYSDLEGGGMVLKRANGNICIMSSRDNQKFFFDEIENETGAVKERYELEIGKTRQGICPTSGEGADFFYSDDKGVYKVELGKQPEKVVTFGEDVPETFSSVYQFSYDKGKFYFSGESYGESSQVIYKLDKEGNIVSSTPYVSDDQYGYTMTMKADRNGKIYALSQSGEFTEEGEYSSKYFLNALGEDGSVASKTEIKVDSDGSEFDIHDIYFTKSGDIVLPISTYSDDNKSYIEIFDASGNSKGKIEDEKISYINAYYSTENGDYLIFDEEKGKQVCCKVDTENYTLGEAIESNIPENIRAIDSDGSYDICYQTSEGIYGYNFADNKATEIINWIDSDIIYYIQNAAFLGQDSIVCQGYDYSTGEDQMYILKRADEETLKKIQNKKMMTIAGMGLGYNTSFREKVVEFNKTSDEYRIQLNDYDKFSKYEDDTYTSGAFQLNNDMAAGNVPDIIIGNGDVDMTSFAAKNVLADLTTYFENDSEIKKDDYFQSVLDLCTYNGKLDQIFASFSLKGIAGPASKLGTDPGWTYEDFIALKKNGRIFYEDTYRDQMVDELIKDNLAEYVDFGKKTCDFDNDRFTGMIDLIAEEGKVSEDEDSKEKYMDDQDMGYFSRYKDGNCQLETVELYSFYDILDLQQGAVSEEIAIKGYPSENGSGITIEPNMSFAICEKSKNKDGAWSFIRQFLSKDYQDSMNEDYIRNLPVRKDAFDAVLARAKNKDEFQYYSITKPDGTDAEMQPLDNATAEKMKKAVESADRCVLSDERIEKIIDEALEKVFNEEKTSKEAAAEIQSKVSTYLNEIK